MLKGLDLETLPVDRALNAVYMLLIENMDTDARLVFDDAIFRVDPLPGQVKTEPKDQKPSWWIEDEAAAHRSTMSEINKLQGG
jgi:hypothetical protein